MRSLKPLSILTILGLFMSSAAYAQSVFRINNLEAEGTSLAKTTENSRIFYSINDAVFEDKGFKEGAVIEFEGLESEVVQLKLDRVTSYMEGTLSLEATRLDNPESQIVATWTAGRFNGLWYSKPGKTLHLGFDTSVDKSFLEAHDPAKTDHLSCGVEGYELVAESDLKDRFAGLSKNKGVLSKNGAPMITTAEEDSITIDLMLVYTDAAETWSNGSAFGSISGVLAQAVNISQTALNNSGLSINLRLVNTTKTTYDETTDDLGNDEGSSSELLRRFTQNPANPAFGSQYDGYMENIHTIRNQVGADVVALVVDISDTGGLGWRLNSSGGSPDFAFNLNRVQQIAFGETLIHEIGHNMGNAHSRTQGASPAGEDGGLFQYSAGYQSTQGDFHTVMAYKDQINQSAPLFSSPDIMFQGFPAGTNDAGTPENNALSMKQIKRTIASYRPSEVDAPVLSGLTNQLTVQMNREETQQVPVAINNTGSSPLTWSVDFDFPGVLKAKKQMNEERATIEPADLSQIKWAPANNSYRTDSKAKAAQQEVLYQTSFEGAESFTTGSYEGWNEWRSQTGSSFKISGANPKTGTQHLRLEYDGNGTQFMASPFFGYQLFGKYEITINFSISSLAETYDFYLRDGKTGEFTAAVILGPSGANYFMFAIEPTEGGGTTFFSTSANVTANNYHTLKFVVDPDNQQIQYIFNGAIVAENGYVGGYSPGILQILHRNQVSGTTLDVDDIEIRKVVSPYEWLQVPDPTGVSLEGTSDDAVLTFSTVGVAAGTYETDMIVTTNDPAAQSRTVPVTLIVADVVSNEPNSNPERITLEQNYPNPFNPATTIRYTLNSSSQILLEVYSINGRKVATLEQGVKARGQHDVTFNASDLSSGVYIYRLQADGQTITKQMVLVK